MDDFSVYGDYFVDCLTNLESVLQQCEDTNLVLNWEKCHFMMIQGIVLGHIVSSKGIEVEIEAISKLPPPRSVKDIRSFLGHAGFYRCFIQSFSTLARPLYHLLSADVPFEWPKSCQKVLDMLK